MKTLEATAFSPRSRASIEREEALREKLGHIERQIALAQRQLAEEEKARDYCKREIEKGRAGQGGTMAALDVHLLEIKGFNARLETLNEMKAGYERQIESEREVDPDRAGIQAALAEVAHRRLQGREQIEKKIGELRAALSRDAALTAEMRGLAERIEFTGDLDGGHVEELEARLFSILPESERWAALFLGQEGVPGVVRAIARVRLEIGEQLTGAGIYQPGKEVLLTEEQFAELSRAEFTAIPGQGYSEDQIPMFFKPRRVVSPERYGQDKADAEAAGETVEEFWRDEDTKEFQEVRAQFGKDSELAVYERWILNVMHSEGMPRERAEQLVEQRYGPRP